MDLDAYTAAHSADWEKLSRLAKKRRLDGRDADELIDLYQSGAADLSAIQTSAGSTAVGDRLTTAFGRISDQLGDRPWLLERGFSAADLYLLMMVRWGRTLPRPARQIGMLGAHAERVLARPAVAKAFEVEKLAAPFV